jgi:flap endonuclease-1
MGTDFNSGIKGIGPKKALNLLRRHGSIENMPAEVRLAVEPNVAEVRRVYLEPEVTDDYVVETAPCDVDGVVRFLCGETDLLRGAREGRARTRVRELNSSRQRMKAS